MRETNLGAVGIEELKAHLLDPGKIRSRQRNSRQLCSVPRMPKSYLTEPFLRRYGQAPIMARAICVLDIRLPFANNIRMAITRRQRQVYDFISEFVQRNGYSPSFEEI